MHICNGCWAEIEDHAYITRCGHQFCEEDIQRVLSAGECPICQKAVLERHVKQTPLVLDEEKVQLALRGFNTDNIFTAAYHAQQFAINQLEMAYAAIQERGQREFEKKYAKARTKLEDVHAAYSKERARRQEMMKALNASKTKQKEIYRRYEQVCGQKRRLEQMCNELRRSHGAGGGNAIHKQSFSNQELRGVEGGPHLLDEDPFGDTPMRDSGGKRGSMGNPVRRSLRTHSPVPMRSLDSLNDSHGEVTTKAMEAPPVMNTNKIPSFGQNINNNNNNNNNDRRRSSFGLNATKKGGGFAPGLGFGSKPQYNKTTANPFASKRF